MEHQHTPTLGTVTRERTGEAANILNPWAYPLRAECTCGETIRLEFFYYNDWQTVKDTEA